LGKPTIASLLDGSNAARIINVEYDMIRRALLNGRATWRFSIRRASLPSLTTTPVSGPYTTMYALPSDCLRILQVGDSYPGLDLSDYRLGPTNADYSQEGRNLLCDYGSPLSLVYAADITDTTQFDPWFVIYFAAELAYTCCERLTGSDAKQQAAMKRRDTAMSQATASNALLNPPQNTADDSWIACRMA
ncbi:MAG: hypothetical protein M3O06_12210, partial [Pseudomonadota bacterium]|nr:hypothetical protein [Pseudomonadota bacterium]